MAIQLYFHLTANEFVFGRLYKGIHTKTRINSLMNSTTITVKNITLGQVFSSASWGDAEVIGFDGPRILISFLNTGHVKSIHRNSVYLGHFADTEEKYRLRDEALAVAMEKRVTRRMTPSVRGVGYLGMGPYKATSPFYRIWSDMLRRCYDVKWQERFPTYKGCTVCEKWLNFQTFCEDFTKIDGYDLWEREGADLDKDTKYYGNKHYSLETCRFVTHQENTQEAQARRWYNA